MRAKMGNYWSIILLLMLFSSKLVTIVSMKILISGTKNAYTTLMPQDVVYYGLPQHSNGKSKALGVYTVEDGKKVIKPLCKIDPDEEEYYIDFSQESMSAESLNKAGRILRIVSSDKKGRDAFVVEEYVEDDVSIPIRPSKIPPVETSAEGADDEMWKELQSRLSGRLEDKTIENVRTMQTNAMGSIGLIDLIQARLEVAMLRLELLETKFKTQQEMTTSKIQFTSVNEQSQLSPRPYSQAVKANGMIFLSGCIGISPVTNKLVSGGAAAELRCALETMKRVLDASNSSLNRVCKVTLLLKQMDDYDEINNVYKEFFAGVMTLPARTTAAVSALPLGASVEIEAIAFERD